MARNDCPSTGRPSARGFVGDDFMILHRLRGLGHAADVVRFFRGEFFEYYRPLAFVSHAIDWAIAGQNARQFHLTNLLIHVVNTILVLLVGRSLSPRPLAGLLAAALFALHASNNEAVVWMSARFDLLATCFALAALYWMTRGVASDSPRCWHSLLLCAALERSRRRTAHCRSRMEHLPPAGDDLPDGRVRSAVARRARGLQRLTSSRRRRLCRWRRWAAAQAGSVHVLPRRDRCDVFRTMVADS